MNQPLVSTCVSCGYDCRALPVVEVCPECGAARVPEHEWRSRVGTICWLWIIGGVGAWVGAWYDGPPIAIVFLAAVSGLIIAWTPQAKQRGRDGLLLVALAAVALLASWPPLRDITGWQLIAGATGGLLSIGVLGVLTIRLRAARGGAGARPIMSGVLTVMISLAALALPAACLMSIVDRSFVFGRGELGGMAGPVIDLSTFVGATGLAGLAGLFGLVMYECLAFAAAARSSRAG